MDRPVLYAIGIHLQLVFYTLTFINVDGEDVTGYVQIFIKLITLSPQTGLDKPRIRPRDLRHSSLTVWHGKVAIRRCPRLHGVYIFILFYLSRDLRDLRVLVTGIFTLMFLICIMLDPGEVETRVKVARSL